MAASEGEAPASLAAERSFGREKGAVLLQDNKSHALSAPVCDDNCGPGVVVICQSLLS